jgi:hypothetical protein
MALCRSIQASREREICRFYFRVHCDHNVWSETIINCRKGRACEMSHENMH